MAELLVDTDIFIDHIRGRSRFRPGRNRIHYSVVTRAELFAGGNENAVRRLLDPHTALPVNAVIAERAGRIRRNSGVPVADALIAATAQHMHLTLVTRNVRDFRKVAGLRVRREP